MAVERVAARAAKAKNGGRLDSRCPEGAGEEGGGNAAARGASRGFAARSRVRIRGRGGESFSKNVLASAGEFPYSTFSHGGVAQLGERLTGSQEVRGSIPLVSTIVNAKAFGIPKAFFHVKHHAPQTPPTPTKSCTIYIPCLYIVCYPNAIISVDRCFIWASGTLLITVGILITCINVNNIPKQPS